MYEESKAMTNKSPGGVEVALGRMEKAIMALTQNTEALGRELGPVLRCPSPTAGCEAEEKDDAKCSVAKQIDTFRATVESATGTIMDILSRIDV